MDTQIYIAMAIAALAVIAAGLFFINKGRKETGLTPLAGLASAFIVAGIVFGGDRLAGYGLFGMGIILAVADIAQKYSKERKK